MKHLVEYVTGICAWNIPNILWGECVQVTGLNECIGAQLNGKCFISCNG